MAPRAVFSTQAPRRFSLAQPPPRLLALLHGWLRHNRGKGSGQCDPLVGQFQPTQGLGETAGAIQQARALRLEAAGQFAVVHTRRQGGRCNTMGQTCRVEIQRLRGLRLTVTRRTFSTGGVEYRRRSDINSG